MTYKVAEIFTSPQGEGLWTGQVMTFIRFVGCSVGKRVCHHCDTDFDKTYRWRGGGDFTALELLEQCKSPHVCLTGGEPFDQDLEDIVAVFADKTIHIESSGTVVPVWGNRVEGLLYWEFPTYTYRRKTWLCISPKPGFYEEVVAFADEVKVIVPGLGDGPGWPTIDDALRWTNNGERPVYLQPRNEKNAINMMNLQLCLELCAKHPELRLSPQIHKYIHVR